MSTFLRKFLLVDALVINRIQINLHVFLVSEKDKQIDCLCDFFHSLSNNLSA